MGQMRNPDSLTESRSMSSRDIRSCTSTDSSPCCVDGDTSRGSYLQASLRLPVLVVVLVLVVALGCLCGDLAAGDSPTVRERTLIVTAEGSGLEEYLFSVVHGESRCLLHRGEKHGTEPATRVPVGSRVLIFAPSYELREVDVGYESAPLRVVLSPSRTAASVVVDLPPSAETVRAVVKHYVEDPSRRRGTLLLCNRRTHLVCGPNRIETPQNMQTIVFVKGPLADAYVWPVVLSLEPHSVQHVRSRELKSVPVDRDLHLGDVALFPDLAGASFYGEAEGDSVLRLLARGLYGFRRGNGEADSVLALPHLGFHLYGRSGAFAVYAYVPATSTSLSKDDLRRPERQLSVLPRVDGKPVDAGCFVVPGRVQFDVISRLAERGETPYCRTVRGADWAACSLAASEWLTVWNRKLGIAFLRWTKSETPQGIWEPGRIRIALPRSSGIAAEATIWPTIRGTGAVVAGTSEAMWTRRSSGGADIEFRGLPVGGYKLRVSLSVASSEGGTVSSVIVKSVVITADEPLATIAVDLGDGGR